MKKYSEMTREELLAEKQQLKKQYEAYQNSGFHLNISRGIPSEAQLELSMGMMDVLHSEADYLSENGQDTRNYGSLTGLPEAKALMAEVMETRPENVIIFCDSSLNIMYDLVS